MQKQFWLQAWAIFGPLKWRMLLVLAMIMVGQGLSLVSPYIQGTILDNIAKGQAMRQTYWLVALAGVVMLLGHILQYRREVYETKKIDFDVDEAASSQTLLRMTALSVGQHNTLHSDLKKSIINRGQHSLTTLVSMMIYDIVPTVTRVLIMTAAMCWLIWEMGLLVVGAMILFIAFTFWQNHIFGGDIKKLERMWNREAKFRGEIIQHIGHVLINAQENKAVAEADVKYGETVAFARPLWLRFLVYAYLRSSVVIVAKVAVIVLGAHYIFKDQHTVGTIVVFWAWSSSALDGLWNIGNLHRQIIRMWTSIVRYCEFLAMESDIKVVANPVRLNPIKGQIEVRNVSFAYPSRSSISKEEDDDFDLAEEIEKPEQTALKNLSLFIKSGETVAVVGETGCGKSTLANLLVRTSDPTEGQILVDGQDLRLLDLQDYRKKVGVVEQHVPLFDRSVRDNILYGLNGEAKDVTEEELRRIAEVTQINRFYHKLEKGFDTLIGERGIKLSGGERQRVGIARALIKDPAILIFDEATSSLDAFVEAEIREAVKEAARGRTTIIIAHRFSTIRYANRIIVMDEGRIVGEGKHADLYESCHIYKRLVDHQVMEAIPE